MAAPTGKGIYAMGPQLYPDGDPAGYAKRLGCRFVALINGYGVQTHAVRAKDLGLQTYLWSPPETWHPDNWADTFSLQMERVESLGLAGLIADVEDAPMWLGQHDDVQALGEALKYASKNYSIGFTSFPGWPYVDDLAKIFGGSVWCSPQLYGVRDPGTPQVVAARGKSWKSAFGAARYVPSIAAWNRSAQAQATYLQAFSDAFAAIMWLSPATPVIDSPLYNVLKSWQPPRGKPFDGRELFSTAKTGFLKSMRVFS
jgi:hypothetical protein